MKHLADLYTLILQHGTRKENRTGVNTLSVFGHQMRFHLQRGFPLATRKFVPFKLVASELLFFLKGQCDHPDAIADLHKDGNHIWDQWQFPDGSFGPIYGVNWRRWRGERRATGEVVEVDQIAELIRTLKTNPESRRMIVSAWQPAELEDMALPPCHVLFQLNVRPITGPFRRWLDENGQKHVTKMVDLQMYQRSCDAFLGVPFNIASYALLLHMLVQCAGPEYTVGDFVWTGGDVHLYENHLEQARAYLHREEHQPPQLHINPEVTDIDQFTLADFTLTDYQHSGKLAGEVAV